MSQYFCCRAKMDLALTLWRFMYMSTFAYADILRPTRAKSAFIYDSLMVLSGSALLAIASQIAVYLPFSPIPVTAQTLAVLMIGAVLGSKRGTLAILAYLAEGAAGLPVFAGGLSGVAVMFGPTAGYLPGFIAAAYLTGFCAERGWDRNIIKTAAMMAMGAAAIHLGGFAWLSLYLGAGEALRFGMYPFIYGDILKIVIASLLLPTGWKLIGKR